MDLDEIKRKYATALEHVSPVAASKVKKARAEHPNIPSSYFDFLAKVGAGWIDTMVLNTYEKPLPLANYVDDERVLAKSSDIVLFADAFGAYWAGIHWQTGMVYIIDPPYVDPQGSFEEFMRKHLETGLKHAQSRAD